MENQELEIVYLSQVGSEILVIFYDFSEQWQFRVINSSGEVLGQCLNFGCFESALAEGKQWLESPEDLGKPLLPHQQLAVKELLLKENQLAINNIFNSGVQIIQKY